MLEEIITYIAISLATLGGIWGYIKNRQRIIRNDLQGQAILLSVVSDIGNWKLTKIRDRWRHPEIGTFDACGLTYWLDDSTNRISISLGFKITLILSKRDRLKRTDDNREKGQILLNQAMEQARKRLESVNASTQLRD